MKVGGANPVVVQSMDFRFLVPVVGLCLAAPAVFLVAKTSLLALAILLRYLSGLAAELFTMRMSLLGAVGALIIHRWGVRQVLHWWLPALLLILSVPLPAVVLGTLALPRLFTAQLLFLYRYLVLLGEETGRLVRARELRAFGRPLGLAGFGTLAGVFPFHTWSPDGHASAPTAVSMLHAGVLMKLGAFAALRVGLMLLPEGAKYWSGLILVLATVRVANIIIWESGLSFLGMGVPPPMPTAAINAVVTSSRC